MCDRRKTCYRPALALLSTSPFLRSSFMMQIQLASNWCPHKDNRVNRSVQKTGFTICFCLMGSSHVCIRGCRFFLQSLLVLKSQSYYFKVCRHKNKTSSNLKGAFWDFLGTWFNCAPREMWISMQSRLRTLQHVALYMRRMQRRKRRQTMTCCCGYTDAELLHVISSLWFTG